MAKGIEDMVSAGELQTESALQDLVDVTAELQEELRGLLSYCNTHASPSTWGSASDAYTDIRDKLAAILDGEK